MRPPTISMYNMHNIASLLEPNSLNLCFSLCLFLSVFLSVCVSVCLSISLFYLSLILFFFIFSTLHPILSASLSISLPSLVLDTTRTQRVSAREKVQKRSFSSTWLGLSQWSCILSNICQPWNCHGDCFQLPWSLFPVAMVTVSSCHG